MPYWKIYEMALWKGKSCDKLNYDTARRRILRSLDVSDCVWRHLCASPAVKSVKIFDKTVVFYLFEALTCDKKNLKWIFFSYGNETCYVLYPLLGDIKHTNCFLNTEWNENSFQILYVNQLFYVIEECLLLN